MGRIKENDRLDLLDDHAGHWTEANALPGGPVTLDLNTTPASTLTLAQFEQLREDYQTKSDAENELEKTLLPALREDRDLLFGTSAEDDNGVWFWLIKYKPAVRLKLGRKNSLAHTIPNLGVITPGDYVDIIQRFTDHWELVNAALPAPFVLGTMTLADLITKHDAIDAKAKLIRKKEAALALMRQQREDFFGDVSEGGMTASIVAHRLLFDGASLQGPTDNPLYKAWVEWADIDDLLRERPDRETAAQSILSSACVEDIAERVFMERYRSPYRTPHPGPLPRWGRGRSSPAEAAHFNSQTRTSSRWTSSVSLPPVRKTRPGFLPGKFLLVGGSAPAGFSA